MMYLKYILKGKMISTFGIKLITNPSMLMRTSVLGPQLACWIHTTPATYRQKGTVIVLRISMYIISYCVKIF